jgi:hypothetical protein
MGRCGGGHPQGGATTAGGCWQGQSMQMRAGRWRWARRVTGTALEEAEIQPETGEVAGLEGFALDEVVE